jgi:hypothetical protein
MWVLEFVINMQRLTARLLLLFALAGNFLPVALAATAAPPRACCLRMAHKCHQAVSTESEAALTARNCCVNHDCGRALTKSQSATVVPQAAPIFIASVQTHATAAHANAPAPRIAASQSPRAPPAC